MRRNRARCLCAAAAAAWTIAIAPTAGAQPVAEFYAGKQISLLVGSRAGGGYDPLL